MIKGFIGRGLEVNLSQNSLSAFQIDESVFKDFLGGYGLASRLILEKQSVKADPLSGANMIVFSPGLLPGTGAPFSGRFGVCGKSPLTGCWGDANSGGFFGPMLKKSGFDIVLVSGISERPVYINIENGKSELRDASHLWGKDTLETEAMIKRELQDPSTQIACIGPAGEKKSLISCIITDGGRAAARSGLGAVMGSKRLKAVSVRGDLKVSVANESEFEAVSSRIRNLYKTSLATAIGARIAKPFIPVLIKILGSKVESMLERMGSGLAVEAFRNSGTSLGLSMSVESGDSPVRNWGGVGVSDFPISMSKKISGNSVTKYDKAKYSCSSCPLGCGALVDVKIGKFASKNVHRPEYETLAAFGSMLLNDNVESIVKASDICNRYGLDTISTGTSIAFAFECYEKGLLSNSDTGGLDLIWGIPSTVIALLERIAKREGLGAVLADGVKKASEKIGKGSDKLAIHIGGEEPGMHDPRVSPSIGTTYLVDAAPGRHTPGGAAFAESMGTGLPLNGISLPKVSRYQYTGKGEIHKAYSGFTHVVNSLGLCTFGTIGLVPNFPLIELVNAATGWDLNSSDVLTIGERIQTARWMFNLIEGVDPMSLKLPDVLKGVPPVKVGPTAGVIVDIDSLVYDYYDAMSYDHNTSWPSRDRLELLGLNEVVDKRLES